MELTKEINAFIDDYVKEIKEGNASLFVGAGMSRAAGYVDWKGLLSDIAIALDLDINKEHDLLSLAQYHVNKNGRTRINKKILSEFTEEVEETENHRIIARLPFRTIWTTNYDNLIEETYSSYNKIVDYKHSVKQLFFNKPKKDLILYKMHGDVDFPNEAILTKEDYEGYFQTHEPFITALSGELISKTFLFLGFSFSDPNIDYVLSRLNFKHKKDKKEHYCLLKKYSLSDYKNDKAEFEYQSKKQQLFIMELKRFGITTLLIDDYSDVTQILSEIENRFKKYSVFISGSAVEYGSMGSEIAQQFIHLLSKALIRKNFRVINGFGLGIGSAVINGALEAIYSNPKSYSEEQLLLKPFPQFKTGTKELPELWHEYREKMISQAGISIIVFGNKLNNGNIENARGVKLEFEIAKEKNVIPVPIPYTGYMAEEIFNEISQNPLKYFENIDNFESLKKLEFDKDNLENSVQSILNIILKLNK